MLSSDEYPISTRYMCTVQYACCAMFILEVVIFSAIGNWVVYNLVVTYWAVANWLITNWLIQDSRTHDWTNVVVLYSRGMP